MNSLMWLHEEMGGSIGVLSMGVEEVLRFYQFFSGK